MSVLLIHLKKGPHELRDSIGNATTTTAYNTNFIVNMVRLWFAVLSAIIESLHWFFWRDQYGRRWWQKIIWNRYWSQLWHQHFQDYGGMMNLVEVYRWKTKPQYMGGVDVGGGQQVFGHPFVFQTPIFCRTQSHWKCLENYEKDYSTGYFSW